MLRVYGMALRTWFDWLEVHVNRNKTHLFFVSMSPIHERCPQKALSYLLIDINGNRIYKTSAFHNASELSEKSDVVSQSCNINL